MYGSSGLGGSTTPQALTKGPFTSIANPFTGTPGFVGGYESLPGGGVDGYGGGGQGGTANDAGTYVELSIAGGGTSAITANGTAGTVNTGGGGGAGSKQGTNTVKTGGAGGSGYAAVIYWS
jgi:hypothetical protein